MDYRSEMRSRIKGNCDVLTKKVLRSFDVFVDVCKPVTREQYEALLGDVMEIWMGV